MQPVASVLVIDWFRVICDLTARGFTSYTLSERIGVPRGTILGWKSGAAPKWDEGERLVALWCEVRDLERSLLPRRQREISAAQALR